MTTIKRLGKMTRKQLEERIRQLELSDKLKDIYELGLAKEALKRWNKIKPKTKWHSFMNG